MHLSLVLFTWIAFTFAWAPTGLGVTHASAADKKPSHQKVIDFEDEIVEGMNKRPLDSLNQVSEKEKHRRKQHLYRKRVGFRAETNESLHELRYVQ